MHLKLKINNFHKIIFILIFAFGCTSQKNSLSYGHYNKKTSHTLHSVPKNFIQLHINDFDLYFPINEMIDYLDKGLTKFAAKDCINYIEKNFSGKNSKIYKVNNQLFLYNNTAIGCVISYYIEYSMDRLVKKGSLYIIKSGKLNKKIYYKKWIPKIQGTIESKWISEEGVEINVFIEGNVD